MGYRELPLVTAEGVQTLELIADLPSDVPAGTAYFVLENNHLYAFDGTDWVSTALT